MKNNCNNCNATGVPWTLRHEIGPTVCSGGPSVHENGHYAGFPGHYDTKSALQSILAAQASRKMARTAVFPDTTTRNRPHSVFSLTKRPGNGHSAGFPGHYDTKSALQSILATQHTLMRISSGHAGCLSFLPTIWTNCSGEQCSIS